MDSSILAGKYIQTILENNEYVMSFFPEETTKRIFALQQPDDINFPFIVYQRNSIIPNYNKDYMGWYNSVQFEIACVSDDYIQSLELANAVRYALEWHYWKDEQITIQRIDISSINEYALDTDNSTIFVQSILISMNILPVKGYIPIPTGPTGIDATDISATGVSQTGVSQTGVSATDISPTGVSATDISPTGIQN